MNTPPTKTLAFAAAAALCATLSGLPAQDLVTKAPAQSNDVVIHGATIHPIDRPAVEDGMVWFSDGLIRSVGAKADVPESVTRIDAQGLHVYPGLIGANTTVGLQEIGAVRATRDEDEIGDTTPEVRAAVAVNPDSTVIPVTRSNGVLTVGVIPQGGLVPGRLSVMQLAGWTWEDMAVEADAGVVVRWPALPRSSSKPDDIEETMQRRRAVDDLFERARAHLSARANDPAIAPDIRLEALRPALRGERPVFLYADALEQIQSALAWAAERELRAVLVGGRYALDCVELLRERSIAVVVTGTHRLPGRRDLPFDEPFRLPAALQEAGVAWCLASSEEFANERNLPYHAASAVAHGLSLDAALRAVTLSAAEILGVADRIGSLTAGKQATLIVTDGNPLEVTTRVVHAFVAGRHLDLDNKHSALARKYREKYRQLGILPKAGK